jgi:hypothetical protein
VDLRAALRPTVERTWPTPRARPWPPTLNCATGGYDCLAVARQPPGGNPSRVGRLGSFERTIPATMPEASNASTTSLEALAPKLNGSGAGRDWTRNCGRRVDNKRGHSLSPQAKWPTSTGPYSSSRAVGSTDRWPIPRIPRPGAAGHWPAGRRRRCGRRGAARAPPRPGPAPRQRRDATSAPTARRRNGRPQRAGRLRPLRGAYRARRPARAAARYQDILVLRLGYRAAR